MAVEFSDNDASEDVEFDDADVQFGNKDPGEDAEFSYDDEFVPYSTVSP